MIKKGLKKEVFQGKKGWKKVNPPMTPTVSLEEGMEIEGIYSAVKKDVGKNKSCVHEITQSDGNGVVALWGSTNLDPQMEQVKIGKNVLIKFKGLVNMKGKKNPMKEFEVYTQ